MNRSDRNRFASAELESKLFLDWFQLHDGVLNIPFLFFLIGIVLNGNFSVTGCVIVRL